MVLKLTNTLQAIDYYLSIPTNSDFASCKLTNDEWAMLDDFTLILQVRSALLFYDEYH